MIKSINVAIGDVINLQRQNVIVEKCEKCGDLMVNLDADELRPGDLITLKMRGVKISNPETTDLVCVKCEYPTKQKETFGEKMSRWFDESDDDNDSSFFGSGGFSGGSSSGGFGGFGGFGGGGVSRGF